jgi:hypothetical protein
MDTASGATYSVSRAPPDAEPEASRNSNLLSPITDSQAHRRFSNKSSSFSTFTDEEGEGYGRIQKDTEGEEEALAESSEDDDVVSPSSDEDETRGRAGQRTSGSLEADESNAEGSTGVSTSDVNRTTSASQQPPGSLLEPSISVTSPTGESSSRTIVPDNNFVSPASGISGEDEDDEEAAIRKAKSLALMVSPLNSSVRDRDVQIILRGNWVGFDKEAKEGKRNARMYLLCNDLSTEATYAMEWVVGTMLRDGDTLLVMNAIDDESAGKSTEAEREQLQADGAQAGKDASEVMDTLTRQTTQGGGSSYGSDPKNKYIPATEAESLTGSADARKIGPKGMERRKAVETIVQTFIKLVRKTTLQVRCMVEVIHCKSPKHLILGAVSLCLCTISRRCHTDVYHRSMFWNPLSAWSAPVGVAP